jgi:uncharacterized OB-fold protein
MTMPPVSTASPESMPKPAETTAAPIGPRERPLINGDNAYFWEGVQERTLIFQKCDDCEKVRHPSSPACPSCCSMAWQPVTSTGSGTVYTFAIVHHPQLPGFQTPYPVMVVEFEEGARMALSSSKIDGRDLYIGAPVQVAFKVDDDFVYPDLELRSLVDKAAL